ncbi:type IV secretion system DNA-binding domain-containing protein [Candidatus Wolfebacteria bacterium]|nr:type IV secretion system DNA-binding domain-containing protein [Candidatus Wolfebacteria bacterium]
MDQIKDITVFAKTNFRNKDRVFGIKTVDRRQHMYVIGKTGVGKSALITNMAIQNIINGHGVCIIDPHGELVETIIKKIPPERLKDVVYFNPIDTEYPIGFNVLEVSDPKFKHLVASDLMAIFTKIWSNVWSARMEYILNNCILALVDTPGTTLMGIPKILVDANYRQQIIANVKDPIVRAFWLTEYESWRDQFRNEAIVPIQNKVGQFLSTPLIRNIVGQSKSTINFSEIINSQKIFLVNLSKGKIGEDNSALLGAMIVTKLQLAAMERVRIPEKERKDFYLYIDEFQNFVTESIATILSEARKYRLNLILAHQYIGQLAIGGALTGKFNVVRDAIFGNVGTMVIFRVGATDAEFLEKELAPDFTIEDMVNLPNYNIYLKLMVDGVTSRPFSAATLPPLALATHENNHQEIIESSRKLYAKPRQEVEEEILGENAAREEKKQFAGRRPAIGGKKEDAPKQEGWQKEFKKIKYATNLGEIGIEFESPKRQFREKTIFEKKENKAEEQIKQPQKTISLSELKTIKKPIKKQEFIQTEKTKETNEYQKTEELEIDELKKAIQKAIENV